MRILKSLPIHPLFYLLVLWFVCEGQFLEFFTFAIVLLLHEFGHFFVSKKCGYQLDRFYIAPYGACLSYKEKQFEQNDEIKIALAGPLANLVAVCIAVSLWWAFPVTYGYTKLFVEESLFLAITNLLPAYPLDGGRVVVALLSKRTKREKATKIVKGINIVLSILFLSFFILSFFVSFNPTFCLMSVFLFGGVFDDKFSAKYKLSFVLKKRIKNFSKPRHLLVKEDTKLVDVIKKIESDTYTIFDVLTKSGEVFFVTENQIFEHCIKNDLPSNISLLAKKRRKNEKIIKNIWSF